MKKKAVITIFAVIVIIGIAVFYQEWYSESPTGFVDTSNTKDERVSNDRVYTIEHTDSFPDNQYVDSIVKSKHGHTHVFAFSPTMQEWYIVTDTGGNTSVFRDQIIEKVNANGKRQKVTSIKSLPLDIVQISDDGKSIGYVVETPALDNTAEYYQQKVSGTDSTIKSEYLDVNSNPGAVYHSQMTLVLIQIDTDKVFTFTMPGDAKAYWEKSTVKSQFTSEGWIKNMIGVWQFVDENSIQFTRYYAAVAEKDEQGDITQFDDPVQISDKELWSYDIATGKLTLLDTIPFEQ